MERGKIITSHYVWIFSLVGTIMKVAVLNKPQPLIKASEDNNEEFLWIEVALFKVGGALIICEKQSPAIWRHNERGKFAIRVGIQCTWTHELVITFPCTHNS